MKIGIIDADLIGRKRHRFPNLVCEKISGYWKDKGAKVFLLMDFSEVSAIIDHTEKNDEPFDKIYISKVFTDTYVPDFVNDIANNTNSHERIFVGGTGFYFDKAPNLPDGIEHHMPDYSLYDDWIANEVSKAETEAQKAGKKFVKSRFMSQFKEYTDYSIGFITRGCFRKCKFCVNQKYDHVFKHGQLDEFYDPNRKKICLLDDNFFGYPHWKELIQEIIDKKRPFKFKQGLDERILTDEKCKFLFSAPYDGDYTFAFDNISDYDLIHDKLKMIRKYTKSTSIKFYVLVGFESTDENDISNAFKRIELLMQFKCLPYIMRYQNKNYSPWKESRYRGIYVSLARWGNQPSIFKKMSFRQFCVANQALHKTTGTFCSAYRTMIDFENEHPEIAKKYFDLRYEDYTLE